MWADATTTRPLAIFFSLHSTFLRVHHAESMSLFVSTASMMLFRMRTRCARSLRAAKYASRNVFKNSVGRQCRTRPDSATSHASVLWSVFPGPWGLNQTLLWARTTCTEVDQKCAIWVRFDTVLYH